jgi:hypothetical protein
MLPPRAAAHPCAINASAKLRLTAVYDLSSVDAARSLTPERKRTHSSDRKGAPA